MWFVVVRDIFESSGWKHKVVDTLPFDSCRTGWDVIDRERDTSDYQYGRQVVRMGVRQLYFCGSPGLAVLPPIRWLLSSTMKLDLWTFPERVPHSVDGNLKRVNKRLGHSFWNGRRCWLVKQKNWEPCFRLYVDLRDSSRRRWRWIRALGGEDEEKEVRGVMTATGPAAWKRKSSLQQSSPARTRDYVM